MSQLIPKAFIQDLIGRIDIVDVLSKYVTLKKKGRSHLACCPFHQEKTPSFNVNQQKQFYHCFGCGASGDVIAFLMDYERLSFSEAVEKLAGNVGLTVPRAAGQSAKPSKPPEWTTLMRDIAEYYHQQLITNPQAMAYLKQRGLDKCIAEYKVGFAPPGWDNLLKRFNQSTSALATLGMTIARENSQGHYDRFRNRIMFPIQGRKGDIIAFGGRVIDISEPKYLNSPETPLFRKSYELYGLYHVLQQHRDIAEITIVEGYMDLLALAEHGYSRAVATLGTATTSQHLDILFRYTNKIVFCFDGDNAGRKAAWRALELALAVLRDGREVRFIFLPQGEDPDSYIRTNGQPAWQEMINTAQSAGKFLFNHIRAETNTQSVEGRALFAQKAVPLIRLVPNPMLRDMLTAELAKITRIATHTLDKQLAPETPNTPPHQRATQTRHPQHKPRLTPLEVAFAQLIQHPHLHQHIQHTEWLAEINAPLAQSFVDLAEYLQETPDINTAQILVHYRDHPQFGPIQQLASHALLCPIEGLDAEFTDVLLELRQISLSTEITHLMQKATTDGLSQQEKNLLQTLMRDKKRKKTKTYNPTN